MIQTSVPLNVTKSKFALLTAQQTNENENWSECWDKEYDFIQ